MVEGSSSDSGSGPDPRLEDRVVALLGQHAGALAFNGLRRSLGVHPESLTRALRRLERYGRISREDGGYRLLDENGPPGSAERPAPGSEGPLERWNEVAEVRLAKGIDSPQVLGLLAGRWAGTLRWVGVYDRAREPLLVWSRTDGPGQVLLGLRDGALRVYAEPDRDGAISQDLNEAARDLLVFALDRIRSFVVAPETGTHSAFVLGPPRFDFGPN